VSSRSSPALQNPWSLTTDRRTLGNRCGSSARRGLRIAGLDPTVWHYTVLRRRTRDNLAMARLAGWLRRRDEAWRLLTPTVLLTTKTEARWYLFTTATFPVGLGGLGVSGIARNPYLVSLAAPRWPAWSLGSCSASASATDCWGRALIPQSPVRLAGCSTESVSRDTLGAWCGSNGPHAR